MAEKSYLDVKGVEALTNYFKTEIELLQKQIDLLTADGTPGSIQYMIDTSISDFKNEENTIYGGSASDLINEEGGE